MNAIIFRAPSTSKCGLMSTKTNALYSCLAVIRCAAKLAIPPIEAPTIAGGDGKRSRALRMSRPMSSESYFSSSDQSLSPCPRASRATTNRPRLAKISADFFQACLFCPAPWHKRTPGCDGLPHSSAVSSRPSAPLSFTVLTKRDLRA